jgi:hypothetical protein
MAELLDENIFDEDLPCDHELDPNLVCTFCGKAFEEHPDYPEIKIQKRGIGVENEESRRLAITTAVRQVQKDRAAGPA